MIQHLKDMEHIEASNSVAIDGMTESADDFHRRYGWCPKGKELTAQQLFIGGAKYAVHAAMTEQGFINWVVLGANEDVTEDHVETFFSHGFCNMPLDPYAILDNASNQRSNKVRLALSALFYGKYKYLSAYSPELNPIERGFKLVKEWIRDHETEWTDSPTNLIHAAFHHYNAENGPGKDAIFKLFDVYRDNYNNANLVRP